MKSARRRELVDHFLATWKVSTRRACRVLRTDRSADLYRSRRHPQAALVQRIEEIAETPVRYGYRRIRVLLRREGRQVNAERIYRLYKEFGLQLRNKVPKRRVKANETWAMDFVQDQLATGRKIRILTVVDTFTRFAPAIEPHFGYRAEDVVEVLERVGRDH